MYKEIKFPVFILEKETMDVNVCPDYKKLLYFVEEFLDILDQDFQFWDREGNKIYLTEIHGDRINFVIQNNEYLKLKELIKNYIKKRNPNFPNNFSEADLVQLYTYSGEKF